MIDLEKLQVDLLRWQIKNFRPCTKDQMLKGIIEEIGELCHFDLKQEQKIRHTYEECESGIKDSVGDLVIYLMQYCTHRGIVFEEIIRKTAEQVLSRNWQESHTIEKCVQGRPQHDIQIKS